MEASKVADGMRARALFKSQECCNYKKINWSPVVSFTSVKMLSKEIAELCHAAYYDIFAKTLN